jgi:hypothetical protein
MLERLVVVHDGGLASGRHFLRRAFDDGHVIPVAIVLREIPKPTLGVPE